MPLTVSVRRFPHILVESGIERLAVGKTNHCTDFLHILVGITLVCQQMHSLLDAVFIQQAE